ncbi:MAG: VWA domain-containing protein [Deltaproteobacteria bacterium]|nr:VWA domain-containing protein [Deltaproteobacteria bacterium]
MPACAEPCGEAWSTFCSEDGSAYRRCLPDPAQQGCTVRSRRVPCDEGRSCVAGSCSGGCTRPQIVLAVDRSSSMAGERWAMASEIIGEYCRAFAGTADIFIRLFPAAEACGAGDVVRCDGPPRQEPSPLGETPIAAALQGLTATFGDPNEAEAVVLITDGDETCQEEQTALAPVRELARQDVATFAIGVSRAANGELLAAIAREGRTAAGALGYYRADDRAAFWRALLEIQQRLEGCGCRAQQDAEVDCYGLGFATCDGAARTLLPGPEAPGGSCACPQNGERQCLADGVIECRDRRWRWLAEPPRGFAICDGRCLPTLEDREHCGGCDPCPGNQICFDGACRCPLDGQQLCGARCVDPLTDEAHCGRCDHACDPGVECLRGGCGRPPLREGVLSNVPVAEMAEWELCWSSRYNAPDVALNQVLAQCDGDTLMLACRQVGSNTLTVAAQGERAEVLFDVGNGANASHLHNGVAWYHDEASSWGFAAPGQQLNRNTCDMAEANGATRLCWHTANDNIRPGWRCGTATYLNDSAAYERLLFHIPRNPGQPQENDLRLAGGASRNEGRVEIYHAGQWGTVCDDLWMANLNGARVVCRQLGLGAPLRATNNSSFGNGEGPIWMDNVQCTGNELRLADCPFNGWGVHNCDHATDAGVVCAGAQ